MTMATINVDKTCSVLPISLQNNQETSFLNDCDINKILGRKLGNAANFRLVCWRLKPLDESKGFLGQYYRLHVMVRVDGKTESLQFFAKCPPPSHSPQVSFLERCDTYNKEIGVYTDLAQRMGASESPRWMVECYFCKPNIIIVLEDVSLDGYITPDKYVPFDEEHCVWLLRSLARLHSKSLILDERLRQESGSTILDFYGHLLKEVFLIENDNLTQTLIISSSKGLCAMVDVTEELDDEGKAIVKRQINEWYPKITQVIKMLRGYRHVACHRDVWANNTLFRYDAVGKPNGCYLVDFQFLCYAPPAIDFMCCLYLTTTRAIRDQNLDSFAKIYYDFFARNLAEESFDVNNLLPWATFQKSYTEARDVALIYAGFNLQIMLLSNKQIKRMLYESTDELENILYGDKRVDIMIDHYKNISAFRTRIVEVILEMKDCLPDRPNF